MTRDELGADALREAAYLEGDFVLRSGKRSSILPRQVPLRDAARPARPARRGDRGGRRASTSPRRRGSPAPELGAVALAAAASLGVRAAVRDRAQGGEGLRHGQPDRGRLRGGRVRLPRRGRRHLGRRGARRGRGAPRGRPRVSHAVCVVDREEGGVDALARPAVRLRPLFRASRSPGKGAANRMVEPYPTALLGFRPRSTSPAPTQEEGP